MGKSEYICHKHNWSTRITSLTTTLMWRQLSFSVIRTNRISFICLFSFFFKKYFTNICLIIAHTYLSLIAKPNSHRFLFFFIWGYHLSVERDWKSSRSVKRTKNKVTYNIFFLEATFGHTSGWYFFSFSLGKTSGKMMKQFSRRDEPFAWKCV